MWGFHDEPIRTMQTMYTNLPPGSDHDLELFVSLLSYYYLCWKRIPVYFFWQLRSARDFI